MRYRYQQWDGNTFVTQGDMQSFDTFMDFLLEYGDEALEALRQIVNDPEQHKLIEQWIDEGLLEKAGARFRLTPRAVNSMQRKALMEVFRDLRPDSGDGHESIQQGRGGDPIEGTRKYQWGDSISDVDLNQTLRNTIARAGANVPLRMDENDFELHLSESKATCSTVILLDMSGSMGRWERFPQAKRCAMAVYALIRQRFPLDTVDVVGFASGAEVIPELKLALATPKRVTLFDPHIRLRILRERLSHAPQHFTNLHLGLMTARQILSRRGGVNKQVFIITDGEPTAYVEGDFVHLIYPPDEHTAVVTLGEAMLLAHQGVRVSTFALIDDYFGMNWVGFVDHLTRLTRGVAFYCTSGTLANCVMESYLSGRKRKAFIA